MRTPQAEAEPLLIDKLNAHGIDVGVMSEGNPNGRFGWYIEDNVLTAKFEEYTDPWTTVSWMQWKLVPVDEQN